MTPEEAKKKVLEKWPEAQAYWTANDIYDTYKIWSAPISSSSAIILGASYPRERKFGPTIQGSEATAWLDAAARLEEKENMKDEPIPGSFLINFGDW